MPRKRAIDEVAFDESILLQDGVAKDNVMLSRLRNMWQFASFMQYIYFFGRIVKIDESLDIEACTRPYYTAPMLTLHQEFEDMCMLPEHAGKLADLGLALLKYVSSHRGLTSVLSLRHP